MGFRFASIGVHSRFFTPPAPRHFFSAPLRPLRLKILWLRLRRAASLHFPLPFATELLRRFPRTALAFRARWAMLHTLHRQMPTWSASPKAVRKPLEPRCPLPLRHPHTAPAVSLDMAVDDVIETEGKITSVLAGTMFRVELSNKHSVLAHISGKMRKRFIRLTNGDRVKLEMSPYDLNKARIVYRLG